MYGRTVSLEPSFHASNRKCVDIHPSICTHYAGSARFSPSPTPRPSDPGTSPGSRRRREERNTSTDYGAGLFSGGRGKQTERRRKWKWNRRKNGYRRSMPTCNSLFCLLRFPACLRVEVNPEHFFFSFFFFLFFFFFLLSVSPRSFFPSRVSPVTQQQRTGPTSVTGMCLRGARPDEEVSTSPARPLSSRSMSAECRVQSCGVRVIRSDESSLSHPLTHCPPGAIRKTA